MNTTESDRDPERRSNCGGNEFFNSLLVRCVKRSPTDLTNGMRIWAVEWARAVPGYLLMRSRASEA